MINRRHFHRTTLASAASLAALAPGLAWAQAPASGEPVEGQHFRRLRQPVGAATPGRIEVVEFFWYGCPHCNSFEPTLDAWSKRLPSDVSLRRVPVAFRENPFVAHQKIYFALEAMNKVEQMHRKVFSAIHVDRQRLDKPEDIAAFMGRNGIDAKAFMDAFNSFGVQTRARQAAQLATAYDVDGVPSMGVAGRFFTSGTMAGTLDRSLAVVDFLVQRVRRGG